MYKDSLSAADIGVSPEERTTHCPFTGKPVIKALGAETCLKSHGLARWLRGGSHSLISLTI